MCANQCISQGSAKYTGVLFDLDNTLADRDYAFEYAYKRFYELTPAVHTKVSWEQALAFFWSLTPSPFHVGAPEDAHPKICSRFPGVTSSAEEHRKFFYEQVVAGFHLYDGTLELLKELTSRDVRWGVITNGGQVQRRKLTTSGIDKLAPFVIVSEEFGADKPDALIFGEGLIRLQIPRSEVNRVVFTGDNPYTDVAGAHSVGMATVWMQGRHEYPHDAPLPDYTVRSVLELTQFLITEERVIGE